MIIHRLILRALKHGDDDYFYFLQAEEAIRWIASSGVTLGPKTHALDLGCGHGLFGGELSKRGCQVTYADADNYLRAEIQGAPFRKFNIDRDDFQSLGQYDLVVCSNVFEHLTQPDRFLDSIHHLLLPTGKLYLSWTNWLSPWGGHEFSPFHYLGPRRGQALYDKMVGKPRNHTVFESLFPTYIGPTLKQIRNSPHLTILRAAPRYYTEFSFLLRVPVVREFVTWNCALIIGRKGGS
jgi:SAM-dependent methyltransferase